MNRHRLWLALVLVYAASFRLSVLDRPFDYDAEGSGCLNGVLARSYLRFGWADAHGMPVLSLRPDRTHPIVFYPDHPPLVPLLIVPFYRAFGVGEWQTRLPMALATIGAILMLYQLCASFAAPRTGLIAASIFAATPMILFFGGFADVVGVPLIFCALLAIFGYLRFQRAPGLRTFLLCLATFVPAAVCDWPAYVLVPVFTIHYVVTRPRRDWPWALAFAIFGCTLFAAVYVYITVATHEKWTWMADLFSRRSALVGAHAYTARHWVTVAARVNARFHTWPLGLAAGAWLVWYGFRHESQPGASISRLLIGWAAVYTVIGGKALYDHPWAWMVLTPGLAVSAGLLLSRLPDVPLAVGLASFAMWTTYNSVAALYPAEPARPFTPAQMAAAIQTAAPEQRDVALLVGNEADAQLWFYADRPLRTGIWSVDDFARRLDDDTVDIMFNFDEQPWKARATGIVFPKIWARRFVALHDYLTSHYPRVPLSPPLATVFDVFDVRER